MRVAMLVGSDDATSGSLIAKHERISPASSGFSQRQVVEEALRLELQVHHALGVGEVHGVGQGTRSAGASAASISLKIRLPSSTGA